MTKPNIAGDIQQIPLGSFLVQALQGRKVSAKAPTSNQALAWNGSQWTPATVLSSPLTTKGDVWTYSSADARLAVGSDHQVLTAKSSATTGNDWEYPPGYEIGYDQITSPVSITGSASNSTTTVIAGSAHTFDGALVIAEFSAFSVISPSVASSFINIGLYESITLLAVVAQILVPAAVNMRVPAVGKFRFTPTAGSHTYSIKAWTSSTTGTPQILADAGSANGDPAFLRFTKV